jgi:uncharacterized membrane protein YqhA
MNKEARYMTGHEYHGWLHRILSGSRYLIIIAVLGSFLASVTVLVLSGLEVFRIILKLIGGGYQESVIVFVDVIQLIDSLLLGTVLYIIALGLYQLFINSDFKMPKWLRIDTLDDLKERLIALIGVMLVVIFLKNVVIWDHSISILWLGISIALVLGVIAYILMTAWNMRVKIYQIATENHLKNADFKQEELSIPDGKQHDKGS